ncbi:MAG: hypothetical protein HWE22_20320 [Flavobacteriales bacterium]|nr:hypothetical protein [Flavobacteriales bacterium]
MKPLIVLLIAFVAVGITLKVFKGTFHLALTARIAISIMLVFTSLGHFMFPDGMALMIPEFIPFKKELVYLTAIFEIAGAIGLHITPIRTLTAWFLILFFILMLPANIKASIEHLDYQSATYTGPGLNYLFFRIPLQVVFILWVYFSSVRNP